MPAKPFSFSLSDPKQVRNSAFCALAVGILMSAFALANGPWLAHGAGALGFLLFAPLFLCASVLSFLPAPGPSIVGIAAQCLACYVLIHGVRLALGGRANDA